MVAARISGSEDGGADAIFQAYNAVQSGGDDNLQHK